MQITECYRILRYHYFTESISVKVCKICKQFTLIVKLPHTELYSPAYKMNVN